MSVEVRFPLLRCPAGARERSSLGIRSIALRTARRVWALFFVLGWAVPSLAVVGCVETVEEFAGLSCTTERGCPTPYACVTGTCKRKLDTYTCDTDVDCPIGLLCDPEQKFCRQCLVHADCPGGRCYQGSHCVQCLAHADCPFGQFCEGAGLRCLTCEGNCDDMPEPRLTQRGTP